ncbi:lasso peptide biosynthesis PqqD family chaperone [Streptomyces specialis]|uniref:lasso peptide biosynthesis PqqD family chaperone n=1 Tax=Streptomyces specialis TaxID=498367 RepID=UPI00073E56DF|nr:lasso peptide biosynthesis PqqD family chaperone [Streptomyces specialis]
MKLNLARDVTLTPIESGVVLLDGRRGRYWRLNESGSSILRKLLARDSTDMAAAALAASAPVSEIQARQDVTALVESLSAAKLVEVTP